MDEIWSPTRYDGGVTRRLDHRRLALGLGLWLLALLPARVLTAESPDIPREQHPWARFDPGSWKTVRIVAETLDDDGKVSSSSTTETRTCLVDLNESGFELEIESSVDVSGKRLASPPQYQELKLPCAAPGGASGGSDFKNVGTATYALDGRQVPCDIYEVQANGNGERSTTRVYYSSGFSPRILKEETITTDAEGQATLRESTESVVATDMPYKMKSTILPTWQTQTFRKTTKGVTVEIQVHSDRIPGGVVAQSIKELDTSGRVIRRSTLELVDYGQEEVRQVNERRRARQVRRAR